MSNIATLVLAGVLHAAPAQPLTLPPASLPSPISYFIPSTGYRLKPRDDETDDNDVPSPTTGVRSLHKSAYQRSCGRKHPNYAQRM